MKSLEGYKSQHFRMIIEYSQEDNVHVVRFPDLPGCIAHGETPEKAVEYALKVKNDWLEEAYNSGWTLPEPASTPESSGRITLRVPKYLHRRLIDRTELEGVSLNQLILSYVAEGLEGSRGRDAIDVTIAELRDTRTQLIDALERGTKPESATDLYDEDQDLLIPRLRQKPETVLLLANANVAGLTTPEVQGSTDEAAYGITGPSHVAGVVGGRTGFAQNIGMLRKDYARGGIYET